MGRATCPGFIRIRLHALTQVHHFLKRLIRGSGNRADDVPSLESFGRDSAAEAYCLIDARLDAGTRCASVFRMRPPQKLLFGGVYTDRLLETPAGAAYLDLLMQDSTLPAAADDPSGFGSSLSTLLVGDGPLLRSAVLTDITHLISEQNYVRLHLSSGESVVMRGPLQKYVTLLPRDFLRLNRGLIVNVARVERVKRVTRDLCVVSFTPGEQSVRVGRKASVMLRNAMIHRSVLPLTRASKAPATTPRTR